jgi:hypothetical protein
MEIDVIFQNNLMEQVQKEIAGKVSKSYDDFVFSLLEQFGVTRENWREWIGRIVIYTDGWSKHFYIDGHYVFSIYEEPFAINVLDEKNDDGKIEISTRYRVEIVEGLRKDI